MITRTLDITGLDGGQVSLTAQQLDNLDGRVEGPMLRAGDAGWDDAVLIWNAMVARTPALVIQPVTAQDVATVVTFARDHRLRLSIKGAGHNIAGTSLADGGLALDMSHMRAIAVDPDAKTARVGPGCLLSDVDRATQQHGLATVLGFISEVGVAGLTLGGGLGYLTRRFGWAVDNLDEVEIVTADGEIRLANRDHNPDLFWAIRGAGANLGVVTRFTFRLHEVGPTVYGGLIAWPFERADEILRAYRSITSEAPRELAVWMLLLRAPAAPFVPQECHGKRICGMAVCYSGDLDEVDEVLAPIRALGAPVVDLLTRQPYSQVQSYLDTTEPKGNHYYWKTEYLAELSDEFLSTVRDLFADCPVPEADIGLLHLSGALNDHDEDEGAVGNRDARYVIGVKGMWAPDEPEADTFRQWVRAGWQQVRPFSTGRTYINFQTADEDADRIRATYGANFDRLTGIKKTYDPDNLFRVNRNISPAAGLTASVEEPLLDHVDVSGLRVAYRRAGDGPPLVLLHGGLGHSRDWQPQLEGLSDEFTVIAWDAPGSGDSSDPPSGFSAADYGDCLAAFLRALGLDRPNLLGLSWGSVLALELYRRHSRVPASLLLASAYAGWAGSLPAEEVKRRTEQVLRQIDLPPQDFVPDWIPTLLTERATPELVADVTAVMSEFHPAGARVMFEAFADADYRRVLPTIDVPTLLLYGELDRRSPLSVARDLHDRIPGSTLVVMPDVGHLSNLEAPGRFNAAVRRFMHGLDR